MRVVLALLLVTVPVAIGCGKKAKEGLPPAESWDQLSSAGAMVALEQAQQPQRPRAMGEGAADPHAGVPGAPPIAGAEDPHAGMDLGGGSVDVSQLGLPPPDPNRKIDPSRRVKGTIRVAAKVKDRAKPSTPVFVVIRRAGADGQPTGTVLAVEKLTWAGDAIPFELTEANAMSAGTELTGDVVVTARYDQDSDAISKQPGDITGQVRVKVPADQVELLLDAVLP